MARTFTNETQDYFDLLPFIAIMMSLLGCLLMVTMSLASLSVGPNAREGWVPVADPNEKKQKTPVLIEWDGEIALIHDEATQVTVRWSEPSGYLLPDEQWISIPGAKLDGWLRSFLERMSKQRDTHYALFAVRPSGFKNFQEFADEFRGRKIDVGYEPILQNKPVRIIKEAAAQ